LLVWREKRLQESRFEQNESGNIASVGQHKVIVVPFVLFVVGAIPELLLVVLLQLAAGDLEWCEWHCDDIVAQALKGLFVPSKHSLGF